MKKIAIFSMFLNLISAPALSNECLGINESEAVFENIFKDSTTIAVYCSKLTDMVDACIVFNEPSTIVSFKKLKINFNNEIKYAMCSINIIDINEGNMIYKKELKDF